MSLTRDRNTPRRDGTDFGRGVHADAVIFLGALVCLDADGFAIPAATATGLVADGVAEQHVDATGYADGAKTVSVRKGVFKFDNSAAADEITIAHIGDVAYIVDDHTVALTDGTSSRSAAGTIVDVDSDGVWIRID